MSNGDKNSLFLPIANTNLTLKPTNAQKLSTGSATGNPRNKCALKPGHSLMDWIRLGNSGVDLAGTRGRVTPVTLQELSKHNKEHDAWMAIRGSVYNVTRYKDFHPGGIEELMRGVGCDATKLFDEVHAWVNYVQLLQKCYIGPLRADAHNLFKPPKEALAPPASQIKIIANEIKPRFDWIQKRNDITIIIYTRQFCNPGAIVQRDSDKEFKVSVNIARDAHLFKISFHDNISWPPQTARISTETGKIELNFLKSTPDLWPTYGEHKLITRENDVDAQETSLIYESFEIVARQHFNHDSIELILKPKRQIIYVLPVGYHVAIAANVNDVAVQRNYTPVDAKYIKSQMKKEDSVNTAFKLNFLIKIYDQGLLSTHLQKLNIDALLQVSYPKGNFNLQKLLKFRHFLFLAAGSGITPFLNIIEHLLRRNSNRM